MKQLFRWTYNLLRLAVVTLIVAPVVLCALGYMLISMPSVQQRIKAQGEKELSQFLGTEVTIKNIDFVPFNRITLNGVRVPDQAKNDLFDIERLSAGINIPELLKHQKIVIDYASIDGLKASITRPDKNSPTNMQFIIDAFKPKDDKPPKPFDVRLDKVAIRRSSMSYDVLNQPHKGKGLFDANHIALSDITLDAEAPRIKNNDFVIDLERLSFAERSGFTVKNLIAQIAINDNSTSVSGLRLELPGSVIRPQDQQFTYTSLKTAVKEVAAQPITINIADNVITPSDFKSFAPQLSQLSQPFTVSASVWTDRHDLDVRKLNVKCHDGSLALELVGRIDNLSNREHLTFNVPVLKLHATQSATQKLLALAGAKVPEKARSLLTQCGTIELDAQGKGTLSKATLAANASMSLGRVKVEGDFDYSEAAKRLNATVAAQELNLAALTGKHELFGKLQARAEVNVDIRGNNLLSAHLDGNADYIDLRGRRYHNIAAKLDTDNDKYKLSVSLNDPAGGMVEVKASGEGTDENASLVADISTRKMNLSKLGITDKYSERDLTAKVHASLHGNSVNNLGGDIFVDEAYFATPSGTGVFIDNLRVSDLSLRGMDPENAMGKIELDSVSVKKSGEKEFHFERLSLGVTSDGEGGKRIDINTDFLNGYISGRYSYKTIVPALRAMAANIMPQLPDHWKDNSGLDNDLEFHFIVDPNEEFERYVSSYVNLPVKLLYRASIDGDIDARRNQASARVSLPYLQQGRNIIEGTMLNMALDSATHLATLDMSTVIPNKKGNIALFLNASGTGDKINTNVSWILKRERSYRGDINLTANLGRGSNGRFAAKVDINPTNIVVNDTVWTVQAGAVEYIDEAINVDNIMAHCDEQFINIDGRVSADPDDKLNVTLQKIHLDYIFETLKINHVDFGGVATGRFDVSDVFSGKPKMGTECLHVDNLQYNGALMGDADIESHWEADEMAVSLDCDLSQRNGRHSHIFGEIFTTCDSLHLTFDADKANMQFMKPFMQAFTDDVSGEASGHAVLFGNFKTIDLYGDVFADELKLKLNYTNVYYTCSDSVHIEPGWIEFKDITVRDRDNHSGKLNGWLKHDSFHDPSFNFTVTDAEDLLCYDITPAMNDLWYGTIYGNGSVIVSGEPGTVKIGVNMETDERSKFTFVLSDSQQAAEYNFLTFRDRDTKDLPEPVDLEPEKEENDTVPLIVRQLMERIEQQNKQEETPTVYSIDLQADITPEAQLTLIMDPVSGDKIKAFGTGNMRLTYGSVDEELEMFGKYTLERGSYNFTLQDIIIKDFTIRDGSTISFNGDPYRAMLDIAAVYNLTANLSDLDQSFATDRDINRTNVPVNALMNIKGEITQPELSFDLEFPTLSSDAYRKVKSVINTDEMMNRQIIYLLALNRFYTPNYMAGSESQSAPGSQLTTVASSTIASQLSSMLGQLSENWTIAPNVRSDKGDFSDVEVDVALSSQLLNNRLILNGNFGYRDNTYNTRNSNFIGDFDLEYLLNRKGSLRLKAYNHFNDQNYYVRNAMTTQGVGVMFKHDFDKMLFLRKRKDKEKSDSTATKLLSPDSTTTK